MTDLGISEVTGAPDDFYQNVGNIAPFRDPNEIIRRLEVVHYDDPALEYDIYAIGTTSVARFKRSSSGFESTYTYGGEFDGAAVYRS